jgi:SPW repeat
MAGAFSLPKQWEDWCSWLLGIWLCISPWALRFDFDSTTTRTAVISGLLIIAAEFITLSVFRIWEEWINVILGAWLLVCSWILGIGAASVRANFVTVGVLVAALAIYEILYARAPADEEAPK